MDSSPDPEYTLPTDCWSGKLVEIYHDQLPHWVVDFGCYALTVHCKDSLPSAALQKLNEIVVSESAIESSDDAFLEESRRHFKMLEYYLDQMYGSCPIAEESIRQAFGDFLKGYDDGLRFRHWVVMPNHVHLLTDPIEFDSGDAFKRAIKIFKMRSTHCINSHAGRIGRLWMYSAYDRWVRNESEYRRWIGYLRNNPVKARLCSSPDSWVGLN